MSTYPTYIVAARENIVRCIRAHKGRLSDDYVSSVIDRTVSVLVASKKSEVHEEWMMAFVNAMGSGSGLRAPLMPPGVEVCLRVFAAHCRASALREAIQHGAEGPYPLGAEWLNGRIRAMADVEQMKVEAMG